MYIVNTWVFCYTLNMNKSTKPTKPLTTRQKSELDKAVKKTVKQYRVTLDLLSKT